MDTTSLSRQLIANHEDFIRLIQTLSEEEFVLDKNQKWTAGQQLEHIRRSVAAVNLAFGLPAFALRLLFGRSDRPSKSYDALVARYHQKLAAGGRASGRFIPPPVMWKERDQLIGRLRRQVLSLNRRINKHAAHLDTLLLPHPLLGKLTLREMLYFTIYHVGHHQKAIQQNLTLAD